MPAAPPRANEAQALAALASLDLPEPGLTPELDLLARMAAQVCQTPIGLVSLVAEHEQRLQGEYGLPGTRHTPREQAFCAHTVLGPALMEVPDARQDSRFADNAFVLGEPAIRFYAGVPLALPSGEPLGALCVVDRQPRELTAPQREALQQLATLANATLRRFQDARQQRLASARLAASEAKLRLLSDSAPVGVFHTDAGGACSYTNLRWQAIYGLSYEQSLGDGWARTLHPDDRAAVFASWQAAAQGAHDFDMEFRILRPDGAVRDVHARACRLDSAAGGGWVGTVQDITAERRAHAFLHRTGKLGLIGGWELEIRTQHLTWSEQTYQLHEVDSGYSPTVETAIAFYPQPGRQTIEEAVQAGLASGLGWDVELPLVTAKGRTIWVRTFGEVEQEGGQPVRLVGAIKDVTEQRQRRLELVREQQLREQVQRQAEETQRLLQERSDMLDVLAHEVRQPLNNASAALQSATAALAGLPHGLQHGPVAQRLARAQAVLAQVTDNIDNTLAVATLLGRTAPLHREDSDIDTLVSVVLAELSPGDRLRVQVQRDTGTRTASMDMSLLRLALRNLLANSLRYSPPGSLVTLRLADADEPPALLIDVIDQGPGIAVELLPRLFERGPHGASHVPAAGAASPGLGLGLYIVRRVMELHGGSVELLRNGPAGLAMRLVVDQSAGG